MRGMSSPRRRSCLARVLLGGAGMLVAVLAIEAWARLANPFGICLYADNIRYLNAAIEFPPGAQRAAGRLFEHKKSLELPFTEFTLHTDAYGLRVPERGAGPRAPRGAERERALRILCIGDSVTFAWGVEERDGWVRVLERTGRARDGRALECLNAGHPKYNTIQEADWLEAHGDALEPDAVVLTYVVNDIEDQFALYERLVAEVAAPAPPWSARAAHWLRVRFHGIDGLLTVAQALRAAGAGAAPAAIESLPEYAQGWPRSRDALERIRAWCEARSVRFLVFDASVPRIAALRAWCGERGVGWADLCFTPTEWDEGVVISKADSHFNARGNAVMADKAAAALRAAGLVD
jgi:lysophospholipase L1-like esterase